MKKSISLLLLSLLMITPSCQKTKEAANEYNIVPKPNQILPQEGRFELQQSLPRSSFGCSGSKKHCRQLGRTTKTDSRNLLERS